MQMFFFPSFNYLTKLKKVFAFCIYSMSPRISEQGHTKVLLFYYYLEYSQITGEIGVCKAAQHNWMLCRTD